MVEWFQSQVGTGSLGLAVPVAVLVGLVSFFSPCVIPLLPGYLSYATGLSGADLADLADGERTRAGTSGGSGGVAVAAPPRHRSRMLAGSLLFVLGFTAVFVAYGAASGVVGDWLRTWREQIMLVMGVGLVVLGLVFAGLVPFLQRERRIHAVPSVGLGAAPLVGALFALGWAPCIGPTYGVIVALTFSDATAARGALLSACYALGLGIPFVVAGLAYRRTLGALRWVRRHQQWVTRVGGLMLVVVGLLMITGWWDVAVQWVQLRLVSGFEVSV